MTTTEQTKTVARIQDILAQIGDTSDLDRKGEEVKTELYDGCTVEYEHKINVNQDDDGLYSGGEYVTVRAVWERASRLTGALIVNGQCVGMMLADGKDHYPYKNVRVIN